MESDDSPVQVETIDDHTLTKLTLKQLDPKSRYRFYLRGRTSAGDGEPITREGATTLDGGRTAGGLELDPFFFFNVHAMWNFVIGFNITQKQTLKHSVYWCVYHNVVTWWSIRGLIHIITPSLVNTNRMRLRLLVLD